MKKRGRGGRGEATAQKSNVACHYSAIKEVPWKENKNTQKDGGFVCVQVLKLLEMNMVVRRSTPFLHYKGIFIPRRYSFLPLFYGHYQRLLLQALHFHFYLKGALYIETQFMSQNVNLHSTLQIRPVTIHTHPQKCPSNKKKGSNIDTHKTFILCLTH